MPSFQDSELPNDDVIETNIGLYICVNIDGIPIKKSLIDTSSNVNICSIELLKTYFPSIYAKMKWTTILASKGLIILKKECINMYLCLLK